MKSLIKCFTTVDTPAIKDKIKEVDLAKIPFESLEDSVIDRAHRIGPVYNDRTTGKPMQSVIVRFTTFRHRTMFYHSRKLV